MICMHKPECIQDLRVNVYIIMQIMTVHLCTYHIHGIIGELNIWQFALKMQLMRLLIASFEYCMEGNPSLNGVHLIWHYLVHDLPNRQIKATAKHTMYMVCHVALLTL